MPTASLAPHTSGKHIETLVKYKVEHVHIFNVVVSWKCPHSNCVVKFVAVVRDDNLFETVTRICDYKEEVFL